MSSPRVPTPEGYVPIPKAASHFVMSPEGYVFNLQTGKTLKQQWSGHSVYTIIRDDQGQPFRFSPAKLHAPEAEPLTKDWVLEHEGAQVIPSYDDYAITVYGAVYRINPLPRGRNGGKVFMLTAYEHQGHECVKLVPADDNVQKILRLDQLMDEVWGDDSEYRNPNLLE